MAINDNLDDSPPVLDLENLLERIEQLAALAPLRAPLSPVAAVRAPRDRGLQHAISILHVIDSGDMLAELPADATSAARHQQAVNLLQLCTSLLEGVAATAAA